MLKAHRSQGVGMLAGNSAGNRLRRLLARQSRHSFRRIVQLGILWFYRRRAPKPCRVRGGEATRGLAPLSYPWRYRQCPTR